MTHRFRADWPDNPCHCELCGEEFNHENHMEPITAFRGRWAKLSNYSPCLIFYMGHAYNSVEHAYQAQKTLDPKLQKIVRDQPTPAQSKKFARAMPLRADWDNVKITIMRELLQEKFTQEPEKSVLLSTDHAPLIEGNWWNDTFWGQCPLGNGKNWLGLLLMQTRAELRDGTLTVAPSEGWLFEP